TKKRKNLTGGERRAAIDDLLSYSENGQLARGATGKVGEKYGCSRYAMAHLWKTYQQEKAAGVSNPAAKCKRHKTKQDLTAAKEKVSQLPLNLRTTQRVVAAAIGLPRATFGRRLSDLGLKRTTRFLKPKLTVQGKITRLLWARRWTVSTGPEMRKFSPMTNVVHVDENFFFLCKDKQKYYVADEEAPPSRRVQHKRHIAKVMFLGAVARPRRDTITNTMFDGKIGLYPFTKQERAQRSGRYRPTGEMVTKMVEVTKETYKKMLIEHVIPDIKRRFPRPPLGASPEQRIVYIQQDNARPHLVNDDPDLNEALSSDGWDLRLINQPANSPDTNILDLGFFNSIQSLQDRTTPRNVDEMIDAVKVAWNTQSPKVLNRVWLSLQSCLRETMLAGGNNDYKIPHMNKEKQERAGTLPWQVDCTQEVWAASDSAL
ncbi:unnamed protein product, partial [Scytosiphon promiscuus]